MVTLRLDEAVVRYFKAARPGWRTRLNEALRQQIEQDARRQEA